MKIAEVVIDVLANEVDRVFDYLVTQPVAVGQMVRVPFAAKVGTKTGMVLALKEESQVPAHRLKPIAAVMNAALTEEQVHLAVMMRERYHTTLAACIRLMIPPEARRDHQERLVKTVALAPGFEVEALQELPANAAAMRALIGQLTHEPQPVAALKQATADVLKRLDARGWIVVRAEASEALDFEAPTPAKRPSPTPDQRGVIDTLLQAQGGAFLLQGVTGSGKTEVYLTVAEHVIAKNQTVLILVPEIALTPQMVERFRGRFGPCAAVLHSRLTPAMRRREWQRVHSGQATVVIGARSAIFAPLRDVGLIVVDEEHEGTYISERNPCYDAVDLALWRAKYHKALVVLGSATPCAARRLMVMRGEMQKLSLPNRVTGAPMPPITLVDMRRELSEGNRTIFSRKLAYALKDVLEKGQQAMLFINRRGFASAVCCRSCGHAVQCPRCDISMTVHLGESGLRCHYCGSQAPLPTACPTCGSRFIRSMGVGTQKVEQELLKLFPAAKVLRMDHDTTRDRASFSQIYDQFRSGAAQVLIGTQMIAKGLDFPAVTLVGVMVADTTLHLPDYRAQEKTFQLITQVAGRCGRADLPGQVVVQTYSLDEPSISAAIVYDDAGFYEGELRRRQLGWYPPFGRFLRVLFQGEAEQAVVDAANAVFEQWQHALAQNPAWEDVLLTSDIMPAPVRRIDEQFRHQILLRLQNGKAARDIECTLAALAKAVPRGVWANLEVNPLNMM